MASSGNSTALQTNFPSALGHYDLRLDIDNIIPRISPLVAMFGKIDNKYKGDMTVASEAISLRSIAVGDAAFRWTEFDPTQVRTTLINDGSGYNTTATTLTVDSTAAMKVGDLLRNQRTGEVMRVTSITNATTVVVQRAWGSSVASNTAYPAGLNALTGVAMLDNDVLRILGSALEQNSTNRDSEFNDDTVREGATQIFRRDISISNTRFEQEKSSKLKTDSYDERTAQATLQIFEDMENMFFFGKLMRSAPGGGSITTVQSGSNNLTSTDGIFHVISQYASENIQNANTLSVSDASGGQGVTVDKLDDMTSILAERPGKKSLFCSKDFKKAVQKLGAGSSSPVFSQQVPPGGSSDLGKRVINYVGSYGDLDLNYHPIYDDDTTTAATVTAVSPDLVKLVHVNNRAVKVVEDAQANNQDGKARYVIGEHGVCIAHAKAHFQFDNFTALGV